MTSFEYPQHPQSTNWWPHGPGATPPNPPLRPGVETRQVLLTLGAACLVVAFTAGTALVWSALGPDGQVALMLAVTAAVLFGAATLRRLPATAEALAAVGLAGSVVDVIAARTLHLPVATGLALHSYVAAGAAGVATVAAGLGFANRRLVSAPLVWSAAPLIAVVSAVNPTSPGRTAFLTPIGITVGAALDRVLRRLEPAAPAARRTSQAFGGAVAVVGYLAALVAASRHDPAAMWGAALPIALLALPLLAGDRRLVANETSAAVAGVTASLLLATAGAEATPDTRALLAVALLVGAVYVQLADGGAWLRRIQLASIAFAYPGILAFGSIAGDSQRFAAVDFVLAVAAVGVAAAWPSTRDGAAAVRQLALGTASLLASVGTGITLDLHGVTTPEAYIAVPAASWLAWGAALLIWDRRVPSTVLMPGLLVGLLPTFVMSLGEDHGRQAVTLVAATVLVVIGAELRLGTPMFTGAAAIGVLSLRLVGPQLATMPKWTMFGAAGAVLLTLGATWEARLEDIHRLRGSLRPRIAALR